MEQQYNEPTQQGTPSYGIGQELLIELGRKNRDKGRGDYKKRDKNDVSTQPPKKKVKKPN